MIFKALMKKGTLQLIFLYRILKFILFYITLDFVAFLKEIWLTYNGTFYHALVGWGIWGGGCSWQKEFLNYFLYVYENFLICRIGSVWVLGLLWRVQQNWVACVVCGCATDCHRVAVQEGEKESVHLHWWWQCRHGSRVWNLLDNGEEFIKNSYRKINFIYLSLSWNIVC